MGPLVLEGLPTERSRIAIGEGAGKSFGHAECSRPPGKGAGGKAEPGSPALDFESLRGTMQLVEHRALPNGGETGSTEVKKFKLHAEVPTPRKTVGAKTNADDYAYAVAA